jgi:ribosomal protein L37AE/L43A
MTCPHGTRRSHCWRCAEREAATSPSPRKCPRCTNRIAFTRLWGPIWQCGECLCTFEVETQMTPWFRRGSRAVLTLAALALIAGCDNGTPVTVESCRKACAGADEISVEIGSGALGDRCRCYLKLGDGGAQ